MTRAKEDLLKLLCNNVVCMRLFSVCDIIKYILKLWSIYSGVVVVVIEGVAVVIEVVVVVVVVIEVVFVVIEGVVVVIEGVAVVIEGVAVVIHVLVKGWHYRQAQLERTCKLAGSCLCCVCWCC